MVTRERSSSQLCAGFKIKKRPTPLFFTYSGEGRNMVFKKLTKPLRGWKPAHLSVREADEYKIGCSSGFASASKKKRKNYEAAITFFADSSWAEVHDWTQRYMQGKAFFHSDIFVTQRSFSG